MLGQVTVGQSSTSPSGNRFFRYEVVGLRQSSETDKTDYQIRSSASKFIVVPYNRMNQEMQRLARMGAKIVNIQPLTSAEEE